MASVEELLMDSLNELEEAELKKFQWYLKNEDRISKSEIAKADIFKTVDMIVACFKQKGAVKITVDTLRKINQNDLAEKLENNYKQCNVLQPLLFILLMFLCHLCCLLSDPLSLCE